MLLAPAERKSVHGCWDPSFKQPRWQLHFAGARLLLAPVDVGPRQLSGVESRRTANVQLQLDAPITAMCAKSVPAAAVVIGGYVVFDGRNIYHADRPQAEGFECCRMDRT
jgi:hypothetical protein